MYAVDISAFISDLATEAEVDEIRNLIEAAIGGWKPTVSVDVREYGA
ncbi:hypothetical protein [Streptomyces sp. B21-083]